MKDVSLPDASGLLPSLKEAFSKSMPSLGEALSRYPDEEIQNDDGGSIEIFKGITETDYNAFGIYLREKDAALADYQVSGTSFSASILAYGKTIIFIYDKHTLEAKLIYPLGTCDEWLEYAKEQLKLAIRLNDAEKTYDAMLPLFSIPEYRNYRPAVEYMEKHPELAETSARDAKFTVGNYVTFGTYPHTKGGKDNTAIEWLVLVRDGQKVLLISRYGLDAKPYNTWFSSTTWEECTLRKWLNGKFLKKAFNTVEQSAILTMHVDNSWPGLGSFRSVCVTKGGNDTQDKVFLLNYDEAKQYFGVQYWEDNGAENNTKSRVAPTAYAIKQGANTNSDYMTAEGEKAGWWWLRSPGFTQNFAAFVNCAGALSSRNGFVHEESACVRPALWVDVRNLVSSDIT